MFVTTYNMYNIKNDDDWKKLIENILNDHQKGLIDHEMRISKLENRKKSKMPAWFYDWNQSFFNPLITEIKTDIKEINRRLTVLETDMKDLKVRVSNLEAAVFKQ